MRRLDALGDAIASMSSSAPRYRTPNVGWPARDAFIARLRERGIPSSTIRQVEAVWDEIEGKSAPRVSLPA